MLKIKNGQFFTFVFFTMCFFAPPLSIASFGQVRWEAFQSVAGKFEVLVPRGEMQERKSKRSTAIGEQEYVQYIHRVRADSVGKKIENYYYIVSYIDYPEGSFHPDSTDLINEFFNTTIEASVASVYGKLAYSGDIQLFTHKGKIWRVTYNLDKAICKSKCFLVGNRFYLVQTFTTQERALNNAADKFLNSFKVY